jgi:hypothetical protein
MGLSIIAELHLKVRTLENTEISKMDNPLKLATRRRKTKEHTTQMTSLYVSKHKQRTYDMSHLTNNWR